ncbi:oxygen-dependent coproporphyrinogen oxidase [Taibaiella helva]|uniref:oxygen-dependent coproporphyrinogen oxidase n=1 Tax=Taibaiella helva TaxID=2301235 RepID=UPI001E558196|nr:oxygen-dependent coproporphyrinogen oxidase [Taibaiella helva]
MDNPVMFPDSSRRDRWVAYIHDLQDEICAAVEETDGLARFREDRWQRAEGTGGGGKTRVIAGGKVFEKGGVNTSVVFGAVTDTMRKALHMEGHTWFACGLSLVLHPLNPFVPTVHANWRYFEIYTEDGQLSDSWFGGGCDLTPYYLFEEDARHFHRMLKAAMDSFGAGLYAQYKKECDRYFVNKHRGDECRGIGGVFYEHLRPADDADWERLFAFQQANGNQFIPAYIPIAAKRKDTAWLPEHKYWQEIRRGRYVEFNLVHDRGTLFGLKTDGRTESILMSLPPTVRFEYDHRPAPGSPEEQLLTVCRHPVDWV